MNERITSINRIIIPFSEVTNIKADKIFNHIGVEGSINIKVPDGRHVCNREKVIYDIRTQGSVGITPLILTLALDGRGNLQAATALTPGKNPGTHRLKVWVGPRSDLDGSRESKNLLNLPRFQAVITHSAAYTVRTTLPRHHVCKCLRPQHILQATQIS